MRTTFFLRAIASLVLFFSPALRAEAAGTAVPLAALGPHAGDRLVRATLAAPESIAPGTRGTALVTLAPARGWHIYWSNPGDAGLPPTATWMLPAGVRAGSFKWPVPERLVESGVESNVYTRAATLLVPVAVGAGVRAGPATIGAELRWLVCANVCIPGRGHVAATLRVGSSDAARTPAALAAARDALPTTPSFAAVFDVADTAVHLSIPRAAVPLTTITSETFFPEAEGLFIAAAPQREFLAGDRLALTLARTPAAPAPATVRGVLAVAGTTASGASATLAYAIVATRVAALPSGAAGGALWLALLLAFAGGLILNLMPCVFPVLAFKAMGMLREPNGTRWLGAGAYVAGVVASCLALGGALLAARAGGAALGWGFQLQSPLFVAFLAGALLFLALSMSGAVELVIPLPGVVARRTGGTGPIASFVDGALVALVASACTAPYMGAALGYTLTAPVAAALGVFAALGLGLALPYALVAGSPAIARRIPRPGAWTSVIRGLLAFPLYATVAWLAWVFAQQTTSGALLGLLFALVLVALAVWAFGARDALGIAWRRGSTALALAAVAGAIAIVGLTTAGRPAPPTGSSATLGSASNGAIEAFAPARLAALRHGGTPVLVDMSAAWCVTCQINDKLALEQPSVVARLAALHAVTLRGDWTQRDPEITAYLASFGRSGVPLYVYYAPGVAPQVWPQLLTPSLVLDRLGPPPVPVAVAPAVSLTPHRDRIVPRSRFPERNEPPR